MNAAYAHGRPSHEAPRYLRWLAVSACKETTPRIFAGVCPPVVPCP